MKNAIRYATLLLLTTLVMGQSLLARERRSVAQRLQAKIEESRSVSQGVSRESRITDEQILTADPNEIVALLQPYEKDPEWPVRHMTHIAIARVARIHPLPHIRQEVVVRLVEAELDGTDPGVSRFLVNFTAEDFNSQSRARIRQGMAKVNAGQIGGDPSVWLCGIANIREELPRLKELLIEEGKHKVETDPAVGTKWYYTTGWAARLARARMGVKEDIAECIRLAEAEPDSDERVLTILPKIGYIRQPEAIEYLCRYLESNDRLPSVTPSSPGELYASRVMHVFAASIQGYPVKQKRARNYTGEEIELCRKWMADKANWKII